MTTRLVLDGIEEFRAALRALPEDLAREASEIVEKHADEAKQQIQLAYPEGPTGNLRAHVTREHNTSRFTTRAIVRSRARHAHLFEFGTRRRQTARGANRGAMPAAPTAQRMIPIAVRVRRQMVEALIGMLERAGFEVRR